MTRSAVFAGAFGLVMAVAASADAGSIQPGDLVVVDRGNGTLDDVNPTTGASSVIASGFSNPQGLAINSLGMLFVSDIGTLTIDEVDPTTGVVTTFSGSGVGSGPSLDRPFQMAFNSSGTLLVADGQTPNGNSTNVLAVAPNGNRTLVAGNNGSSNNLFDEFLAGLAVDSNGNIFASAPTGGTIYHVTTGAATSLSTAVSAPQGLAFGGNGRLLAVNGNPSNPQVWSIDPTTGNASLLADNNGIGTGPAFGSLRALTVAPNGEFYATDVGNNEIFEVNPLNGNRTVVSGNGIGGTTFGALTYGIAIEPAVPEPSSLALSIAALGAGSVLFWNRGRSRLLDGRRSVHSH